MGRQGPKMSARVVNAIRSLRDVQGSSSKQIMSYIMSQYDGAAPNNEIQRQMNTALKRGLDYGILKKISGRYSLNTNIDDPLPSVLVPVEQTRRRRSRRRRSRQRGRKKRRARRRRRRSRRRRRPRRGRSRARSASEHMMGDFGHLCRLSPGRREETQLPPRASPDKGAELMPEPVDEGGSVCGEHRSRRTRSKSRQRSRTRSRSALNRERSGEDRGRNTD